MKFATLIALTAYVAAQDEAAAEEAPADCATQCAEAEDVETCTADCEAAAAAGGEEEGAAALYASAAALAAAMMY